MLIEVTTIKEFKTNLDLKRLNLFSWYYRKDRFNNSVFLSHHYVQNSLSYPAKETQPTLCLKGCQAKLGLITLRTINEQLLHRIQSIWTPQTMLGSHCL